MEHFLSLNVVSAVKRHYFIVKRLILLYNRLSIVKLICIMLSVYVLILSTLPCCSDINCIDEVETANGDEHRQDQNDDGCKSCSQYLSCGSCSGFVFLNLDSLKVYLAIETLIPFHMSLSTIDFIAKIWQPPNLR
jgi:hypothetical protein